MKKRIDIAFVLIVFIVLIGGMLNPIINSDDINDYENRMAYKIPEIKVSKFFDKSFQNELELMFSDQIPLSTTMKRSYNFFNNLVPYFASDIIFADNCSNMYIKLSDSMLSYGCDKNLVYAVSKVEYAPEQYNERIEDINKALEATPDVETHIYYIEKDTDIYFATNEHSLISDYIQENLNTSNFYTYEINDFETFKNDFYKTDHHWNYKGAYRAYLQLVEKLTDDKPMVYTDEKCFGQFSGSKASYSGADYFYKEDFCAYNFDFPEYDITINGYAGEYGNEDKFFSGNIEKISYGDFYGYDLGEIIIDSHQTNKDNILVIGESYDNALLKNLASHFNKTFSMDLRYYSINNNNKKFDYVKYIEENDIDKVLLIGNIDFFRAKDFYLGV